MHEALAGSKFVELPGAGHISNLDQPNVCSRAMQEFLST
jgi:pimeloyl-ACP methyl ester carboxylesterase